MLFNLEFDKGDVIQGYVVPDGFSEQPAIRVFEGRDEILSMDCDGLREAVVTSGRHSTGMIGFRLDDALVPGIRERRRIAIYERKSGLLVYRRVPKDLVQQKRVLRLETQLAPFMKLDRVLDPHFQYPIRRVERFGHETAMQAFHLNAVKSIYISGRLLLRNYEEFLEKGFDAIALLNDPYLEMAERLLLFARFSRLPPGLFGERDSMILMPAIQHFEGIDLASRQSLAKAFRSAGEDVQRILTSPLTHQLVAAHPEQVMTRQDVAPAMDALSRFAILGLKSHPETFTTPLAEFFDIDASELPQPTTHLATIRLAGILRQIPACERLLEFDLILHHFVSEAITQNYELTVQGV